MGNSSRILVPISGLAGLFVLLFDSVKFLVSHSDSAWICIPNFAHNFRQRYSPMPVERPRARPLLPVKPLSKILGSSSSGMPRPLSATVRRTPWDVFSVKIRICGSVSRRYFTAFSTSWSRMKAIHFVSV